MAEAVRCAMGVTDGSGLSLKELAEEAVGRDQARQTLRALALLHAGQTRRPPSSRARALRALHMRLARCMALFSRCLTLSDPSASRRSGPGVTAA
ncbi:hypothetical protein [Kitasatospora fiedleri]|uniref:hypothetical protein n=1 Tax=Kitasatospora fiedleri TaxID=2991545 RepID=UPI00249CEAF2|nr:hypothetical protein [Kitasatospora fiedleri]